jgi:hypothetical protein
LREVGLAEGNARDGYYLPDWLRVTNIEQIIAENAELTLPSPSEAAIGAVKIRIASHTPPQRSFCCRQRSAKASYHRRMQGAIAAKLAGVKSASALLTTGIFCWSGSFAQ